MAIVDTNPLKICCSLFADVGNLHRVRSRLSSTLCTQKPYIASENISAIPGNIHTNGYVLGKFEAVTLGLVIVRYGLPSFKSTSMFLWRMRTISILLIAPAL